MFTGFKDLLEVAFGSIFLGGGLWFDFVPGVNRRMSFS